MGDKSIKAQDLENIGRAQARRVQERPAEAPFGMQLSNEDLLKLSKAAAKNLIAAAKLRGEQNISAEEAWDSAAETLNTEAFPDGGFKTSPGDEGKFPKFDLPTGAADPEGDGRRSFITPEARKGTMKRTDI